MAENLRFVETLDHSNFDKGIAESTSAVRKLAEDTELASKGLKGMFDTPAMKEAAATFSGVTKAVEGFTRAMSRGLPMKQELRETQKAAMQLEQIWRGLSDAEKQSAAGQELRSKIDMLIQRGGVLKDTMIDVGNAIKFQASDTAKLDAVVGGVQALTAAAQVASGAMAALGMNQEDAAKVQKDLIAIMSVVNGLQVIQNALQKESALMMGLSAARTAALNTVTAVKVAMAKADTVATKGAAAAQVLFNHAVKANPIGMLVTVLAAVVAGIWAYNKATKAASQGDIEAREALKRRKEELDNLAQNTAQSVGKQIAAYQSLRQQWLSLKTAHEQNAWITANKKAFSELGLSIKGIADAENVFVKNTDNFVKAMIARGRAAAFQSQIEKETIEWLEKREKTNYYSYHQYKAGERSDTRGLVEGVDYTPVYQYGGRVGGQGLLTEAGAAKKTAEAMARGNKEALDTRKKIDQDYNSTVTRLAHEAVKATAQVATLTKGISQYVGTTSTTTGGTTKGGTTTTTTTKNEAPEGSLAALDAQISEYKKKMSEATTQEAYAAADKMRMELAKKRFWLDIQLRLGDEAVTELQREFARLPKMLKARNIKLTDIFPAPAPQTLQAPKLPNVHFDGIAQAQQDAQELLDKTEGLRSAANAAASAFSAMGNAIGGQAGKVVNVAAMIAQAIATMIQGYATATAQEGLKGGWNWIAFGLTGLAQLLAMISAVKSVGFAQGGIVGGTSYSGDKQYIRVNSGEMILNGQQQARLFSMINSGGGGGEVTFRIAGQQLVGVLNNYNGKMSKVR